MPVHQRGAKMRTLQVADQLTGGASIPVAMGGSWWVPDASTGGQAMAATVSTIRVKGPPRLQAQQSGSADTHRILDIKQASASMCEAVIPHQNMGAVSVTVAGW